MCGFLLPTDSGWVLGWSRKSCLVGEKMTSLPVWRKHMCPIDSFSHATPDPEPSQTRCASVYPLSTACKFHFPRLFDCSNPTCGLGSDVTSWLSSFPLQDLGRYFWIIHPSMPCRPLLEICEWMFPAWQFPRCLLSESGFRVFTSHTQLERIMIVGVRSFRR